MYRHWHCSPLTLFPINQSIIQCTWFSRILIFLLSFISVQKTALTLPGTLSSFDNSCKIVLIALLVLVCSIQHICKFEGFPVKIKTLLAMVCILNLVYLYIIMVSTFGKKCICKICQIKIMLMVCHLMPNLCKLLCWFFSRFLQFCSLKTMKNYSS